MYKLIKQSKSLYSNLIKQSKSLYSNINGRIFNMFTNNQLINRQQAISLILQNGKVTSASIGKTQSMANKEKSKLDKVKNTNLQLFKVILDKNIDKSNVVYKKNVKTLLISTKIADNDLQVKIKQMIQFLKNNYKFELQLKVVNSERANEMIEIIKKEVHELAKSYQIKKKDHFMKFVFEPLRTDKKNVKDNADNKQAFNIEKNDVKVIE